MRPAAYSPLLRNRANERGALAARWTQAGLLLLTLFALGGFAFEPTTHARADEPPTARLDPQAPYAGRLGEPVEYDIDFRAVVTPPYRCQVLKVWLPLPPSDNVQEVRDSRLSTFPMEVEPQIAAEPTFGNRFAYFEFQRPQGAQIIGHRFRATVREVRWQVDPAQVATVADWPASFAPYLRPHPLAADDAFRSLTASLASPLGAGPARPRDALWRMLTWVDDNLQYDHVDASLRADARHAFEKRRGHCSDYHGLCDSMSRALGYPSRVTYGWHLFPKNSPSHCKFEAYLPPYGWVSFDVSETQRMIAAIGRDERTPADERERLIEAARTRLKSGFRDDTWLLLTRGVNFDLAPPASGPVPVVRTIYAEADGEVLPDPDPANHEQREFGWMTAHRFRPSRPVPYPFSDTTTLKSSSHQD